MMLQRVLQLAGFLLFTFYFLLLTSCSVEKQISKSARADVLTTKPFQTAHVGISIFDPAANKYLYNHQGDKYFVPASNIKIPTCYAAMKYLGDSLVGMRYDVAPLSLTIFPTADPTFFLWSEFKYQPVFDFLVNHPASNINISTKAWEDDALGSGWSWNDYQEYYMVERSFMPMFGNMIEFSGKVSDLIISPDGLADSLILEITDSTSYLTKVQRDQAGNIFRLKDGNKTPTKLEVTFDTKNGTIVQKLLGVPLNKEIRLTNVKFNPLKGSIKVIKSQPTDSVLKPMMHRSDNFFAEQLLLMVSNEQLGLMNDSKIIDTLLKTDFKDIPHKPRWADGSGLSRYNLFTPQDFVFILNKMKNEFGMERLKVILPTGGEGTISSYYKADSGYIYGKTGTLSGVVAFSGFFYTKKGKLLIFSTLVNNHQASATDIRRAIEKFLQGLRNKY